MRGKGADKNEIAREREREEGRYGARGECREGGKDREERGQDRDVERSKRVIHMD